MNNFNQNLEKYADLLVRIGINVQENQILVITSPIECADFARLATKKAYEAGAREVVIRWVDELSSKIKYDMANDEVFDEFPDWNKSFFDEYSSKGAAFLSISASDPELMKDVDPKKISRQNKASGKALQNFRSRMMNNQNVWCVASIPTDKWAMKVFPDSDKESAIEKLWNAIFKAVRIDEKDPIQAWIDHQNNLDKRIKFLNENNFESIEFKNSLGTDINLKLPKGHIWVGGASKSENDQLFIANMPTEEVFTLPSLDGANGVVKSSMPLNYNGNLIEDFSFTFKDGIVVDYDAKKGKDVLTELLNTDEGAKRLGEVALVPYDSPISNQKILFFNTLFDENASCHFALGKAYPSCLKSGDTMDIESLKKHGANDSLTHVDFMIGTDDMSISGINSKGEKIEIFKNGNFIDLN